ncbi:MAG TPA: hypothetical protein VFR32_00230 [Gaiellaceae bacterium]|nr:hypothetical protein [Gaiellaceae bacterium]
MRGLTLVLVAAGATAAASFAARADTVTISAHPLVVRWPTGTTLSGFVSSGQARELVNIEAKECPSRSFRTASWTRTTGRGAWEADIGPRTRTVLRARWGDTHSREVVVLVRPHLVLGQISRRLFRAQLLIGIDANGKRLLLQRFDAEGRAWKPVKSFVFDSPSTGWPQMTFSASVPKGATVRLALPRARAQPCYLGGYSNILTT